jgi:hypothetical protein
LRPAASVGCVARTIHVGCDEQWTFILDGTHGALYQYYVDYIHYNPVKHDRVKRGVDWPYSSFHRYIRLGVLDADWAGCAYEEEGIGFGE